MRKGARSVRWAGGPARKEPPISDEPLPGSSVSGSGLRLSLVEDDHPVGGDVLETINGAARPAHFDGIGTGGGAETEAADALAGAAVAAPAAHPARLRPPASGQPDPRAVPVPGAL